MRNLLLIVAALVVVYFVLTRRRQATDATTGQAPVKETLFGETVTRLPGGAVKLSTVYQGKPTYRVFPSMAAAQAAGPYTVGPVGFF